MDNFENILASANYADEQTGYRTMIDLHSFYDLFIINEISKNIDAYRTSTFFYKDRDDKNNKLVAGPPWDYNLAFGNANYYRGEITSNWVMQDIPYSDARHIPFWWQRFLDDPVFFNSLKERYTQFRGNVLRTENIHSLIDSLALVLQEPQQRNYSVWKILGRYIWPNPFIGATYQQEIDYLKGWIGERTAWIDSNLLVLANPETSQIVSEVAIVYPNPFSDRLYIEFLPDAKSNEAILEIYDISGKKLLQENLVLNLSEGNFYTLDQWHSITSLSRGIYILKIRTGSNKNFQAKIIRK